MSEKNIIVHGNPLVEEARLLGLELNQWTVVHEGMRWLERLREATKNNRLTVVSLTVKFKEHAGQKEWSEETSFVLATWIFKPEEYGGPGIVQELEAFDRLRGDAWPEGLLPFDVLVARCRPVEQEWMRKKMEAKKKREEAKRDRFRMEYDEHMGALTKAGAEEAIPGIERGMSPVAFSGDVPEGLYGELNEVLKEWRTGKRVSGG